jgi:hypothetical protein
MTENAKENGKKEDVMYWFDADGKALDTGDGASTAILQVLENGKIVHETRFSVDGPMEKSE